MSAYAEQMAVVNRQEEIQKGLEECGEDMDRMANLLDELQVCTPAPCLSKLSFIHRLLDRSQPACFANTSHQPLFTAKGPARNVHVGLDVSNCKTTPPVF